MSATGGTCRGSGDDARDSVPSRCGMEMVRLRAAAPRQAVEFPGSLVKPRRMVRLSRRLSSIRHGMRELHARANGTRRSPGLQWCFVMVLTAAVLAAPADACTPNVTGTFDGNGLPHGEWHIVHCDGTEARGRFRHGDRDGSWEVRYPDGRTGAGSFANGRREGAWTYRYPDGSRVRGAYRNGLLEGVWTLSDANGAAVERECWRSGRWIGVGSACAE